MRTKLVNEDLEDIMTPRSKEEIEEIKGKIEERKLIIDHLKKEFMYKHVIVVDNIVSCELIDEDMTGKTTLELDLYSGELIMYYKQGDRFNSYRERLEHVTPIDTIKDFEYAIHSGYGNWKLK